MKPTYHTKKQNWHALAFQKNPEQDYKTALEALLSHNKVRYIGITKNMTIVVYLERFSVLPAIEHWNLVQISEDLLLDENISKIPRLTTQMSTHRAKHPTLH